MDIEISMEYLTKDSVSIKTQKYIIDDGVKYTVGKPHNVAYINNASGRENIILLGEPYVSSIFSIWGNEPTIFPEEMEEIINEDN